jgi:hypothetical protein
MDPSLAFDLSDYGHLGYYPERGAPNPEQPVHDQYMGTWDICISPNSDTRLGQMLAQHVLHVVLTS